MHNFCCILKCAVQIHLIDGKPKSTIHPNGKIMIQVILVKMLSNRVHKFTINYNILNKGNIIGCKVVHWG